MDNRNEKGYTPLFSASKFGSLSNIIALCDHGADVNHESLQNVMIQLPKQTLVINSGTNKTPLFKARTYDTVKLLLRYGADPFKKTCKDMSVIEHLMQFGEECPRAILDDCMLMNQTVYPNDERLIMNLEVFDSDNHGPSETKLLKEANKMLVNNNESTLFLHPLLQIFLFLKFKTVSKYFWLKVFFHICVVIGTLKTFFNIFYFLIFFFMSS